MAKSVVLIAGNICAGKSEFLRYLEEHKDSFAPLLGQGEEATLIPEFVDPEALPLFYQNRERYTNIFERSCLTARQVRHMRAKEGKGLYIFDRGMIEGAETFARNSFEEGYSSHAAYQRYLADLKEGLDELGRTQQESWLEQFVVYLRVPDVEILQRRQQVRKMEGEAIPIGYLQRINQLYEEFMGRIGEVYATYGVRPPQVIEIDAGVNFRERPTYHQEILETLMTKMRG